MLEAVARQEDIQVTAEEIGREIGGLAAALGREPKDLAKSLDRTGQVVALAGDIIRSKALDLLVEHADIRSDPGTEEPTREGRKGSPTRSRPRTKQQRRRHEGLPRPRRRRADQPR